MKRQIFILLISFLVVSGFAQISHGGQPKSFEIKGLKSNIDYRIMPEVDVEALLQQDAIDESYGDIPWRFGKDMEANFNLDNSGTWEILDNGDRIWRLEITSYGAYSINLIYDVFKLPKGAVFFVYNAQKSHIIGSFTSMNNKPDGSFATVPVRGETSILEYYEPADVVGQGRISVSRVIHAYKNIFEIAAKGFGSSGECNVNVNCPEGDGWRDQQRGVAMILTSSNSRICSGSMINNTAFDGTPYFLTANHCGSGSASNWIIMFNYESPSCEDIDGPTDQSIQYTTVKASSYISDFLLLELSEVPPQEYDVYYNGWSRSDEPNISSTAIHHPRGDIKKITLDNDTTVSDKYINSGLDDSHWRINRWDLGTTEGGSSGSPLFNNQKQIMGQLHGGYASCADLEPDWYGKFSYSWDYFEDSNRQLKYWLDPANTGEMAIDGLDISSLQFDHNAQMLSVVAPQSLYTQNASIHPEVIIKNKGLSPLTSLNVSYKMDDNNVISKFWEGELETGDTAHIIFPEISLELGIYQFKAYTDSPNGVQDEFTYNDTLNRSVEVLLGYDLAFSEFYGPQGINCKQTSNMVQFMLVNQGTQILYGFDYQIHLDGELVADLHNNNFMDPGEEQYVSYNLNIDDEEWHTLEIDISITDEEDQDLTNNHYISEFHPYGNGISFSLGTDNHADETSWVLKDENGEIVESGDNYENNQKYRFEFCLESACYQFVLYDSGHDGIDLSAGGFKLGNDNQGNIYLNDEVFTDSLASYFCITKELYCDFNILNTTQCLTTDVNYHNLSVNADSYQWTFEGGIPSTSTEVNPVVMYNATGIYDVKLISTSGNESLTMNKEDYITVVNCSGIEELQNDLFKLYPNPSKGLVTIELLEQNKFDELVIYNSMGEVFRKIKIGSESSLQMDLQLSAGVYIVELKSDNTSEKRMLLIN